MFLLRCTFWLSIVYASMSWGAAALRHHDSSKVVAANGPGMLQPMTERAIASVAGFCAEPEARCFKDARSLTTLVSTVLKKDYAEESMARDVADIPVPMPMPMPMPMPVPRRRVATAVLTHTR